MGIVLVAVIGVPSAWLVWKFHGLPLQPIHPAKARVVAIAPTFGRSPRQWIIIRNAHGTGSVSVPIGDNHCSIGDVVTVNQRGTTLSPQPTNCR
jgi:hypothetical protein